MSTRAKTQQSRLALVKPLKPAEAFPPLRTIDLFSGAGGITEGFRMAGYECLYANDSMPEAMETFRHNHPEAWGECRNIEQVKAADIRAKLKIKKGAMDVLVGGPPCQGFSRANTTATAADPRNELPTLYVDIVEDHGGTLADKDLGPGNTGLIECAPLRLPPDMPGLHSQGLAPPLHLLDRQDRPAGP